MKARRDECLGKVPVAHDRSQEKNSHNAENSGFPCPCCVPNNFLPPSLLDEEAVLVPSDVADGDPESWVLLGEDDEQQDDSFPSTSVAESSLTKDGVSEQPSFPSLPENLPQEFVLNTPSSASSSSDDSWSFLPKRGSTNEEMSSPDLFDTPENEARREVRTSQIQTSPSLSEKRRKRPGFHSRLANEAEVIDLISSSSDEDEERVQRRPLNASRAAIVVLSSSDDSDNDENEGAKTFPKEPTDSKKTADRLGECSNSTKGSVPGERALTNVNLNGVPGVSQRRNAPRQPSKPRPRVLDSDSSDDAEWTEQAFDQEENDDDENDSIEEITRRTKSFIINDDSLEEDDSESSDGVTREPPPTSTISKKAKPVVSKRAFLKSRQETAKRTFTDFDTVAFGGKLSASTTLEWSNKLRTTAGITRLHQLKRPGQDCKRWACIELSTKIIDELPRLRSTLLHEMCHAAAWLVDGVCKPPHGPFFRKWANRAMSSVSNVEVTTTHDYAIAFKYAWACTKCHTIIQRHSRSVSVTKHRCGKCKGVLQVIEPPNKKNSGIPEPRKKAPPSAYNLFVKAHSKSVRQRLEAESTEKVMQPQVMKECARLWREQKTSQQQPSKD